VLIAVEGIDGAGKYTQANLLAERIAQSQPRDASPVVLHSFPDYRHSTLGPKIRHYLKGGLGKLHDNSPMLVALLFALERFEKRESIESALGAGQTIVCDRYTPSNLAHQAAKYYDGTVDIASDWMRVLWDIATVEYCVLGMPTPDLVIYLDLTAEQSKARTAARDNSSDLHQDDLVYLSNTRAVYQYLTSASSTWHTVACFNDDGTPRTIDQIHDEIFNIYTAAESSIFGSGANISPPQPVTNKE